MKTSRVYFDRVIVAIVGIACLGAPALGVSYCKKAVPGSSCAKYFILFDSDASCCPDQLVVTAECQSLATPDQYEQGRFDSTPYRATCKFKRNSWNVPGSDPCKPGVPVQCILDPVELSGDVDCEKPSGTRFCVGNVSTP